MQEVKFWSKLKVCMCVFASCFGIYFNPIASNVRQYGCTCDQLWYFIIVQKPQTGGLDYRLLLVLHHKSKDFEADSLERRCMLHFLD